jgi:hypothetical protein
VTALLFLHWDMFMRNLNPVTTWSVDSSSFSWNLIYFFEPSCKIADCWPIAFWRISTKAFEVLNG